MSPLYLTLTDPGEEIPVDVCVARDIIRAVGKRNRRSRELCGDPAGGWVGGASLCDFHYKRALAQAREQARHEVEQEAQRAAHAARVQAEGDEMRRYWADQAEAQANATSWSARGPGIVYYVRRADGLVKIGTTTDFRRRMITLQAEHGTLEVLFTHRGNRKREHEMHLRFADLRVTGEWFRLEPELAEWILAGRRRQANRKTVLPGTVALEMIESLAIELTTA